MDGLFGAEDHAEALARQVEQLRVVRPQLHQAVEHRLGLGDLEPRAEGAAGVHQCHQVLGILAHRLFKRAQRLLEPVKLPQRARLLQFGHINAQAGNHARWGPAAGSERCVVEVVYARALPSVIPQSDLSGGIKPNWSA